MRESTAVNCMDLSWKNPEGFASAEKENPAQDAWTINNNCSELGWKLWVALFFQVVCANHNFFSPLFPPGLISKPLSLSSRRQRLPMESSRKHQSWEVASQTSLSTCVSAHMTASWKPLECLHGSVSLTQQLCSPTGTQTWAGWREPGSQSPPASGGSLFVSCSIFLSWKK